MNARRHDPDRERKAALRRLDELGSGGELLGSSQLAHHAERARRHMTAAEADQDDRIEVWGRRIGRALSVVLLAGLVIYLAATYL
ncbi:hypothetical protein [Lutibaculum baratangense]|uniref:Transmembrane protein n=1 Tax=Lutibaculum baratangense AMV1 TaxID=631454 RepID=V4TKI3_9HYPH|nr:hypothetical protein [Lutibaculum baratangense]ESR26368.1 hypothetical protein N177_0868 [Lutibaculum baratangense AMV1]